MPIHDWIQSALLVVITIFSIGRWAQSRESTEVADSKDTKQVRSEFDKYCVQHEGEHRNLWLEIERQRKRWHEHLVPWQQQLAERIARFEEHEKAQDSQLQQLWVNQDRRRQPRE